MNINSVCTILLKKLYAIRGNILEWCTSYLKDRSQYVVYNEIQSDIQYVMCVVPQGSIKGPLLFIIYIHDIFNASQLLFNILYADDTSILMSGINLNNLVQTMNSESNLISN